MVTDQQVRKLMKLVKNERTLSLAAAKAGMCEQTARKYLRSGKLPSEAAAPHTWRTRTDPFDAVWDEVTVLLDMNAGLEAKTLFEDLQRRYPGHFADGQLRTLQRRVKVWRALEGPEREVFFAQTHLPGVLCQSDFTHMAELKVSVGGQPFDHMVYHFVLTHSNWETGTVCFSESFESLAEGLERALWELGAVPEAHQSDRLTAAVTVLGDQAKFTDRYNGLLRHYGLEGRMIQTACPNENGDIEQRHYRFKKAVDQALMLRGSREFKSREDYETFLRNLFVQLNAGRRDRLTDELKRMHALPEARLDAPKKLTCRVGQGSTINADRNVYSVPSRLIGASLEVRLYAEYIEVWYAQQCIETMPRIRGRQGHRINYRHVISWLVRKPGAFANYRYRDDLFPTSYFRMAYDALVRQRPNRADKTYLRILHLAARENETAVHEALRFLINTETAIDFEIVEALVHEATALPAPTDVHIDDIDLDRYDALFDGFNVVQQEVMV
jgi:Mu transposase-like protein